MMIMGLGAVTVFGMPLVPFMFGRMLMIRVLRVVGVLTVTQVLVLRMMSVLHSCHLRIVLQGLAAAYVMFDPGSMAYRGRAS